MHKGISLVEMMVAVVIFSLLFAAILTVLLSSDRSWRLGRDKLIEQQDARLAMDEMTRLLRQSNAEWKIGEFSYPVTISDANRRVDFYNPIFDSQGGVTAIKKVTFKLNPTNQRQLLKKEGTQNPAILANEVEAISFAGGCAECASFNCTTVATDCPILKIQLTTKKLANFVLDSQVTLRNRNPDLEEGVGVEEPGQGEF